MRNKIYIILILLSYVSTASVSLEGSLDLRPTWSPASPSLHYENELGVKLKWNEVSSFGYVQEFVGNLIGKSELNSFDLREGSIRGESKINSTLHFEAIQSRIDTGSFEPRNMTCDLAWVLLKT